MRRYSSALLCVALLTATAAAQQAPPRPRTLAIVDRAGNRTVLGEVPGNTWGPRVSPDGIRLAYALLGDTRAGDALYAGPLMNPAAVRRIGPGRNPYWSHDGTRLFFTAAGTETLLWRRVDADDDGEQLLMPVRAPESRSADGRLLSYVEATEKGFVGWMLDLATRVRTPLRDAGPESLGTNISPDGRWIAYQSTKTGQHEIWVQPLGRTGPAVQVTTQPAYRPVWSADMREMFFDDGKQQLYAVAIRPDATFALAGRPVALPIKGFVQTGIGRRMYDLLPDGRFVMLFPREP